MCVCVCVRVRARHIPACAFVYVYAPILHITTHRSHFKSNYQASASQSAGRSLMSAPGCVAALLVSELAEIFEVPSLVTRLADWDSRYSSGVLCQLPAEWLGAGGARTDPVFVPRA